MPAAHHQLQLARRKPAWWRGARLHRRRRGDSPHESRRTEDLAEAIAGRVGEVHGPGGGEQGEEQRSSSRPSPISRRPRRRRSESGKQRILDAALREDIVLHARDEEVRERLPAKAQHVADAHRRAGGGHEAQRLPLDRVDDGGGVERTAPDGGVAEQRGDRVELSGGREVAVGLDGEQRRKTREQLHVDRGRQLLQLGDESE